MPSQCLITADLTDLLGIAPSYGAAQLIISNPSTEAYGDSLVLEGTISAYCDYDGEVQVNVIESETLNFRYLFQIQYMDDIGLQQVTKLGWAIVPNQESVNLATLTFYPKQDSLT